MQELVRISHFVMKHHNSKLTSHQLQMLWKQYNKPDPLGTPCTCCQTKDYISHETSIVRGSN